MEGKEGGKGERERERGRLERGEKGKKEEEGAEMREKGRRRGEEEISYSSSQMKGKDFVPISFPSRVFPLNFS